tara:strand:- start:61 stop:729 length:669 start_codon:yes stop_codon:yes gene_type:complete
MIEVKNLSKTFIYQGEKIKILDDVSFKVENKDKIAVIGRNGAGKSTFLNIIGGVESPDKGEIKRNCSISWPVGKSAGFVPNLTGRQNTTFVLKIFFGNDKNLIREKLKFIHEFSELGESFDRPFMQYSRGMKSRISFSLSMAFDFDVFLLDEFMGGGDENFQKKSTKKLDELIQNKGIFLVTHNLPEYIKYCNKALLLNRGKLIEYDIVNEAIKEHKKLLSN